MQIGLITIFPSLFNEFLKLGVVGRANLKGLVKVQFSNPRDFAKGNYHRVDDKSFGGGGQVMMLEPLVAALKQLPELPVIYLSASGVRLNQGLVNKLAKMEGFNLVCGRYEGLDERFVENFVDLEVSLGDFVISGGELAAQALMDSVIRTLPGVLKSSYSVQEESFMKPLLDFPHYTHPRNYEGLEVPQVLLSGDHQKILQWRQKMSLQRTLAKRPDLFAQYQRTLCSSKK